MTHTVILSAARTPTGRMGGSLASVEPAALGGLAIREACRRAGLNDLAQIDEIIMGNVVSAGLGQNIGRQCGLAAEIPASVGALTINKVCGASLKAVALADQAVRAGDGHLYVTGGVESASHAPHLLRGRQASFRYGQVPIDDALHVDGLQCAIEGWPMGDAAEFIADEFDIDRDAMDRYALASHLKAIAAIDDGRFDAEIVPIPVHTRGGNVVVDQDESVRRDTSIEALGRLRPAFAGTRVTAGNAPGLNDAAAAVVVASNEFASHNGLQPLGVIRGAAQSAAEPRWLFDAPAHAIRRLVAKLGWTLADVDLLEINEAFAAQALANGKALADEGWDWDRVNVNGGAIALGHPLGATGARLLTTLLYALRDRGLRRGIAALCLGGGEAIALAIEVAE
ncbi:MAG: acetyl-CoA C-acyltransferase [Acidobacteria bacterium]|nr:acetyl-CoA C-acyltransferase [Acidobacteriota bacterium]